MRPAGTVQFRPESGGATADQASPLALPPSSSPVARHAALSSSRAMASRTWRVFTDLAVAIPRTISSLDFPPSPGTPRARASSISRLRVRLARTFRRCTTLDSLEKGGRNLGWPPLATHGTTAPTAHHPSRVWTEEHYSDPDFASPASPSPDLWFQDRSFGGNQCSPVFLPVPKVTPVGTAPGVAFHRHSITPRMAFLDPQRYADPKWPAHWLPPTEFTGPVSGFGRGRTRPCSSHGDEYKPD